MTLSISFAIYFFTNSIETLWISASTFRDLSDFGEFWSLEESWKFWILFHSPYRSRKTPSTSRIPRMSSLARMYSQIKSELYNQLIDCDLEKKIKELITSVFRENFERFFSDSKTVWSLLHSVCFLSIHILENWFVLNTANTWSKMRRKVLEMMVISKWNELAQS